MVICQDLYLGDFFVLDDMDAARNLCDKGNELFNRRSNKVVTLRRYLREVRGFSKKRAKLHPKGTVLVCPYQKAQLRFTTSSYKGSSIIQYYIMITDLQ